MSLPRLVVILLYSTFCVEASCNLTNSICRSSNFFLSLPILFYKWIHGKKFYFVLFKAECLFLRFLCKFLSTSSENLSSIQLDRFSIYYEFILSIPRIFPQFLLQLIRLNLKCVVGFLFEINFSEIFLLLILT